MIDITTLGDLDCSAPRRIMKHMLIWCEQGELVIQIDGKDFKLSSHEIVTITSGQVHFIKEKSNTEGFLLEFTYDFFCKDDKDIELIFENGLFCHFDDNQVVRINNYHTISDQLKFIEQELNEKPYQYFTSIHSRIELILVDINRAKIGRGDEIWKPDALFLKFLELVRSSFNASQSVKVYAKKLKTTEQKLNEQAKTHTGKTAQMVIYGLIASEAKRLLIYESMSVKEIAFQLGFNDPFYFSNFFKRHTGIAPKVYREQLA